MSGKAKEMIGDPFARHRLGGYQVRRFAESLDLFKIEPGTPQSLERLLARLDEAESGKDRAPDPRRRN